MEKYTKLFNYIKSEIDRSTLGYDIKGLETDLKLYERTYNALENNIASVSIDVIYNLLKNTEISLKVEEYIKYLKVLIDLEIENLTVEENDILGYKISESLIEIKEKLMDKINKIKELLAHNINLKEQNLIQFEKYLSYFDISTDSLIKPISSSDLKELLEFIKDSSLDKDDVFDLILNITIDNKILQEKKLNSKLLQELTKTLKEKSRRAKRNQEQIETTTKDIEEVEEPREESFIVEEIKLTEEEEEKYQKIKDLFDIIKSQNLIETGEMDALKLIDNDDKYNFNIRKNLCESEPSFSIWRYIYLDLKQNFSIENKSLFIKFYRDNKDNFEMIFNYYIELYQKKFISKENIQEILPKFDSDMIKKIRFYNDSISNLSIKRKQMLIYADYTYMEYGEDGLREKYPDITKLDIDYYKKLEEFKENYQFYIDTINFETNDKEYVDYLKTILEESKEKIETIISELEELKNQLFAPQEFKNQVSLIGFIPEKSSDIKKQLAIDILDLKSNYGGLSSDFLKEDVEIIDAYLLHQRFLDMSQRKAKERLRNESGNLKEFAEDKAYYRVRGVPGHGGRVPYLKLEVTESNRIRLAEHFNMPYLDSIYVIIKLDGSIGENKKTKRSDKDYVVRSHEVVHQNIERIKEIKNIFEKDFTDETFKQAINYLTISNNEYQKLKDETSANTIDTSNELENTEVETDSNEMEVVVTNGL